MELVAQVLRKDRKAAAEFVARCSDHVYAYVSRRLIPHTELVDDLVQEIFLAAWENLHKFRGDSPLHHWLLGIARHKVEDHYRERLRESQLSGEEETPAPGQVDLQGMEEALEKRWAGEKARQVLATLPETYSVVLLWRYWEQQSLREIAAQTGKTEKGIERLLARARNQFKKNWNEH
ncbi:MAG: RNA polymerase sigma factor [Terriglobia bacterium]